MTPNFSQTLSCCDPVDHQLIHSARGAIQKSRCLPGLRVTAVTNPPHSPTFNYYIRSPGLCFEPLENVLCLFEKLWVSGLRGKNEKKKNTWDRKQSGHNAFTMLFASPFSQEQRWVQPDSWSILALCLSKRLHGTGCCESLVDILFTVHFEGGEKAGFPCILFFRQSQQLGSNTHEQRVHKQHQRRSTHLQWLQLSKLMQLHSQSFNSSLKTVKQNTVCIHESQNLVICYLLFICPLGIQYIGQLRF